MSVKKNLDDSDEYYLAQTRKDLIVEKLRENGCRITKQRLMLLDIILEENCSCCKEIYYRASKLDSGIGTATVYRMVNLLEEIGAISRTNMYRVICEPGNETSNTYLVELDDHSVKRLSFKDWNLVIREGMRACGFLNSQDIISVSMKE